MPKSDHSENRDLMVTANYQQMVRVLGEELGFRYGWKKMVATRLGISPSHLSKILANERVVGAQLVDRAVSAVGIDQAYFVSTNADFREHQRRTASDIGADLCSILEEAKRLLSAAGQGRLPTPEQSYSLASRIHNMRLGQLARVLMNEDESRRAAQALALAAVVVAEAHALCEAVSPPKP